jgi:CheY-like chemotaxis protein
MDVQMPEMDGLEATAAIRRAELGTGRRLPIVALTANAMKGDREACLAAGTDGYLSKPLNVSELVALIEKLLTPRTTGDTSDATIGGTIAGGTHSPASLSGEQPFDIDELSERVEGDKGLVLDLLRLFREQSPRLLAEIRRCAATRDSAGLQHAAHSLKGACANLGARPAMRAASALEAMGRDAKLEGVMVQFAGLEREARLLEQALAGVIEAPSA